MRRQAFAHGEGYTIASSLTHRHPHTQLLLRALRHLLLAASMLHTAATAADVPEPEGYRLEEYDAPVPQTITGGTVVDATETKHLRDTEDALVIDVIPEHRKPDFLPENQIWIPPSHRGIPGSIWLPDIGYGVLSDITEAYFKNNLQKHTTSREHPIIFYCRLDCWMSWNAAKRALTFGYKNVYWFSEGIDGWTFEDFDLEKLTPEPGQRQ